MSVPAAFVAVRVHGNEAEVDFLAEAESLDTLQQLLGGHMRRQVAEHNLYSPLQSFILRAFGTSFAFISISTSHHTNA